MQHKSDQQTAEQLTHDMVEGCVGVRVGRLHRLVAREFERRLRPLGLSLPQLEVLSTLTGYARPVKPSVVADRLTVERSTMSRNLAVLMTHDWVVGTDISATGRALAVTITAAGTAKLAQADQAWRAAQAALITQLGAEAPGVLDRWLRGLSSPQD